MVGILNRQRTDNGLFAVALALKVKPFTGGRAGLGR